MVATCVNTFMDQPDKEVEKAKRKKSLIKFNAV